MDARSCGSGGRRRAPARLARPQERPSATRDHGPSAPPARRRRPRPLAWLRRTSPGGSKRSGAAAVLGLPAHIDACLFDLDGVLTSTAEAHARPGRRCSTGSWTAGPARTGDRRSRSTSHGDYEQYVDGKPRLDGVRSFLASRGHPPSGGRAGRPAVRAYRQRPGQPQEQSCCLTRSRKQGVRGVPGTLPYLRACEAAGKAPCAGLVERERGRVSKAAGIADLLRGASTASPPPSGPRREAGAGHVPRRGASARRAARRGRRLRGRARGGRGRTGGRLRLRRRCRPGRAGRGAARARCRHRRRRPR